jgi:excisionase family DNA binding protein
MSQSLPESMDKLSSLQFFSVAEVAQIMGVSSKVIHQWIQNGHLPAFRVGTNSRVMRIRHQDLENFIDANTQPRPSRLSENNSSEGESSPM